MTDDELDEAVAREVMGWPEGSRCRVSWEKWSPATDIADAFEVVERMRATHAIRISVNLDEWEVDIFPRNSTDGYGGAVTRPLPRAICEAALAAVRSET